MQDIRSSKAAGVDKLLGRFLKYGADILVKTGSELFNLSSSWRIFPSACEVAKLKPILKKGNKDDSSNHRPVYVLPVIFRIIEKVVHDETNAFLSDENTLDNYQSVCRASHSTNICFSFLTYKIWKGFEKGLLTGMTLIDLQKVFDTIDHKILPQKLKAIRFPKRTIQWFRSYLSEQTFIVSI